MVNKQGANIYLFQTDTSENTIKELINTVRLHNPQRIFSSTWKNMVARNPSRA